MAETGKPDQLTLSATRCVSLEWEKLWHPYLAPLDDALAAAAKRPGGERCHQAHGRQKLVIY